MRIYFGNCIGLFGLVSENRRCFENRLKDRQVPNRIEAADPYVEIIHE